MKNNLTYSNKPSSLLEKTVLYELLFPFTREPSPLINSERYIQSESIFK